MIRQFDFDHDLEPVLRLWQHSGPGVRLGVSDSPEEIQKKLVHDPELFLVAEEKGQIVGTVLGGFDGRRGMVYHLAVALSHRSNGLGSALMDELETRLKAKGCRKYYLQVTADNETVIHFYKKLGWSVSPNTFMSKAIDD